MHKRYFFFAALLFVLGCKSNSTNPVDKKPDDNVDKKGWNLVWSDEFNYKGLPDSTKWGYDVGGSGWGNEELEYYTSKRSENARVEDSTLIIEARNDNWNGHKYTSARLVTTNKGDWTYGRFEIRAKLPGGKGTWPAIWMLPTEWIYGNGGWPDNGEIDIMEYVGYDPGKVHGSIHCNKYNFKQAQQRTSTLPVPDAESKFHTYVMEWYPDRIDLFVDSFKYFTHKNENTGWQAWPFDRNFHFLLNLAIGGTWGGAQGVDDYMLPQRMVVDYVRVYKWVD
ncbi:MAG: family 16 glycosylhydrolase [Syntrophomonadaceae bacterium]